ncbi:MAG: hypothetical protein LBB88_01875 [Planctomycetaceae bacterium]|nr:hypothetical protein [Planctomycetaceae bacterium]
MNGYDNFLGGLRGLWGRWGRWGRSCLNLGMMTRKRQNIKKKSLLKAVIFY